MCCRYRPTFNGDRRITGVDSFLDSKILIDLGFNCDPFGAEMRSVSCLSIPIVASPGSKSCQSSSGIQSCFAFNAWRCLTLRFTPTHRLSMSVEVSMAMKNDIAVF